MMTVLYVEDEQNLALIVSDSLESHGFTVVHKGNGAEALAAFKYIKPDVVVLDVMMPLMDGFTVAEEIRKLDLQTPILFLTAMTQTEDVVRGFNLGGDDYVRKPFKIEELIVRIEALTRKSGYVNDSRMYAIGRYRLDTHKSILELDGKEEKLSFREMELVRRLFESKDRVLPREEIIKTYWDNNTYFTGRSLDVFISRIRKYLSADERIKITNVRGVGYMLTID